ncbi:molybdopterin binding aldehyde oxidase/xanthine dehydrogenase [Phyllosticta citriasiana]|uniref:Molybdopterin binding aldehyde oxidase/xanthine dehydrogenase n=1 Tax=Phyllosticta citriasiana TaxID=595635 RepID=A0ABR1KS31_9PEZI
MSPLPKPPLATRRPATDVSAAEALTPLIQTTYTSPTLRFFLNGNRVELHNPNPHWTLLDFIRDFHDLKGTKLGCGEGGCGACTVVLSSPKISKRTKKIEYLAVNACLFPLVGVDGKHIITIEGIGNVLSPHPLQERIAKLHGSQCGFCTPGIVMSLYALVRNAYNPDTGEFHLSEHEIEDEGHLDGNLCRCTGYKPILHAAKTFVREDLNGRLAPSTISYSKEDPAFDLTEISRGGCGSSSSGSCGKPGGCCRDKSPSSSSSGADSETVESSSSSLTEPDSSSAAASLGDEQEVDVGLTGAAYAKPMKSKETKEEGAKPENTKAQTALDAAPAASRQGVPHYIFKPYQPNTELIFPPSLWKHSKTPLCFGDDRRLWFRPVTLEQLVQLKNAYPSAKLVGGASEVQVEVRFKNSSFAVSVYVSDIEELQETRVPQTDAEWDALTELYLGANTPLSELEHVCKVVYSKLGQRALALEALRKQLRYFAGRQIRNVASLAGNVATASPISDGNPVLLAAGADIIVQTKEQGSITLPMSKFFVGYRTTTLPPDGVITHIRIPLPPASAKEVTKAYKQAKRKDDDIAIVTAGFRVRLDEGSHVEDVCLAYGGMAPTTVEAKKTQQALLGKRWFESTTLEAGLDALAADFNLSYTVPGGMAHYRRALALSFFFRFWHEAVAELGIGRFDKDIIDGIHRELSTGTRDDYNPLEQRVVGKQVPHLSALKQCTGEAEYLDDIPRQDRELFGSLVLSAKAHARIADIDWTPALALAGVVGYIDKKSIPAEANMWGSKYKDEPFFADSEVLAHGQVVGMVYADTSLHASAAAKAVKIVYEDLPAILTIDEAIEAGSMYEHENQLRKGAAVAGNMDEAFAKCDRIFTGVTRVGGQDHFYLETNAALAIPSKEDGSMEVWSSTQNTMETQEFVSQVLGVPSNRINVRVKRMGGAFGGKESRSVPFACYCAIAAKKEGRPIRVMLNRDEDMATSGQRHPVQARWKIGTTREGRLLVMDADLYANSGFSQDLSGGVMDRCCTHLDNCYNVPDVWIRGRLCKTNIHSNTAFRGFGGPQAMFIAEQMMHAVAEGLGLDVDELRLRNLYNIGDRTPFHQLIDDDWHVPTMLKQLKQSSDYEQRKSNVAAFNASHRWRKRGISLVPCKFGLSFATAIHLNQAGASVKVYADGSVLLHHGGTEMGQGLYTKMCQIAAQELGVPLDAVYTQDSQSYQTANASPTAASSGSDLNGMAVKDACDQLNQRLQPYWDKFGRDAAFKTIAHAAYLDRVNLAANGFWKMPRIGYIWGTYDAEKAKPMYYYWTQGVACSEVELDLLTGAHTVLRSDILMDVGQSINPAIDYGQIEGAFIQGMGLFTTEQSLWTARDGALATSGPGTYKIPAFADIPQVFNAGMLRIDENGEALTWNQLRSVQSSKGIGEPPLFLGATVFFALREAVRDARVERGVTEPLVLHGPATAERLRLAVGDDIVKRSAVERKDGEKAFFVEVA